MDRTGCKGTHAVQSIVINDVNSPTVEVTCIFAPNTTAIGCKVSIVLVSNEASIGTGRANRTRDFAVVTFQNIPAGQYHLHVFDVEKDGTLNLALTELYILPPNPSTSETITLDNLTSGVMTYSTSFDASSLSHSPKESTENSMGSTTQSEVVLAVSIGVSLSLILSFCIVGILIWKKHKPTRNYSLSGSHMISHSQHEKRPQIKGKDRWESEIQGSCLISHSQHRERPQIEADSDSYVQNPIEVQDPEQKTLMEGTRRFVSGKQQDYDRTSTTTCSLTCPLLTGNDEKHDHAEVEPSDKFMSEVAQGQSRTSPSAEQPSETKPTAEKQPVYAEVLHMKGPRVPLPQEVSTNYSIVDHNASTLPIKNNQKEKQPQANHKATAQLSSEPVCTEPPPLPLKNIQRKTGAQEGNSSFCELDLKDSHF